MAKNLAGAKVYGLGAKNARFGAKNASFWCQSMFFGTRVNFRCKNYFFVSFDSYFSSKLL